MRISDWSSDVCSSDLAVMMVATRTDEAVLFPFPGEDHGFATAALVPEIVRRLALGQEWDALADAGEPAHAGFSFRRADGTCRPVCPVTASPRSRARPCPDPWPG